MSAKVTLEERLVTICVESILPPGRPSAEGFGASSRPSCRASSREAEQVGVLCGKEPTSILRSVALRSRGQSAHTRAHTCRPEVRPFTSRRAPIQRPMTTTGL